MKDFVHLHVHTQYSILDGQASIPNLVEKALKDGMRGMAVTDHGNMMGIKEFYNYVKSKRKSAQSALKDLQEKLLALDTAEDFGEYATREEAQKALEQQIATKKRAAEFKPIFGCEMYVARRGMRTKECKEDQSGWHLIVLAKNEKGYHNLIKLVSHAWVDGFYMRPRTDHAELEKYREGLIVCSACIGGEVPQKILSGNLEAAEEAVLWFKKCFGDDYYLELQRHEVKDPNQRANRETFPLQQKVNRQLVDLAHKHQIKLMCSNDSHFVNEENAEAHDRLICLSTGRDLDDPKRMLYTKQEWFKTQAEMNHVFEDIPEALENTCEILDKIEVYSIDHAPIMPNFAIPEDFGTEEMYREKYTEQDLYEEFTRDEHGNVVIDEETGKKKIEHLGGYEKLYRIKLEADYLSKLAYEGAHRRYGEELSEEVTERINFELYIMKTMGFPGYFLIVQDYINAARNDLGVSVGPGRGSAAGSVVAYCLGITQIDPIKYDLLFERFLNPDRISLPDIDVDFDDDGRGRVLNWVTQKYGAEKVAHIITYGKMATKLALKDVARVQKLPLEESNRLCKLVPDRMPEGPDGKTLKMNLPNVISISKELQEAEASSNKVLADTIKFAKMLEGNIRNTGVHACGTIICRDDVSDWVPVSTAEDKDTKEKLLCTQYDGRVIEETGLIKMDFLGLKTLSIIKEAVENIRQSIGIEIDIDNISIDDPATYQLYCDGRTVGTFQFESPGMQKYLRQLQPSTFEDLIAMNALYRPGPMDYIPSFIARKHGKEPIEYDLPCMEKYLKDTYGITVYQEQVMLLSRVIANFTRGESDTLRKAMGKKLIEKLNHMYPKFIEGGKANGYDPKILEKIWEDWRKFASYAFNKSHATCYSWVAYQTAYLKANFPSQYMAGNMTRNKTNISEITKLMDECKSMGIRTLCPDVNESRLKFSVNRKGDIRFGMAAVKGVGEAAVEAIVEEREKNGLYKSVYDFFERINYTQCNRKAIESLIYSGAFDSFETISRDQFFAENDNGETFVGTLIRYGIKYQQDKALAQNSLFGSSEAVEIKKPEAPTDYQEWGELLRLNKEREYVGIYLTAHPLDEYYVILHDICNTKIEELEDLENLVDRELTIGGIVSGYKEGRTKKGNPYGRVVIEDYTGSYEFVLFGRDMIEWKNYFLEGNILYIRAKVQNRPYREDLLELKIAGIDLLSEIKDKLINKLTVTVYPDKLNSQTTEELAVMMRENTGNVEVYFKIVDSDEHMYVLMKSSLGEVEVKKSILDFFDAHSAFEYKIN
jgi:DNA polymerase III, alpha subunit